MITEEELSKEFRTIRIIWFALFFSLAVYLYVGLAVCGKGKPMNDEAFFTLKAVLFGGALVLLFITKPVRKFILNIKGPMRQRGGPAQRPEVQKYVTAMIVACAMSEAIGIFGLVLYILGKNAVDLYVLIGLSAFATFQYRPKKEELRSLLSA